MTDVLLNNEGDIAPGASHTSGLQETVQKIAIRLKTHRGEWLLNEDEGIPYLSWVQARNTPLDDVESVMISEIEAADGVISVDDISVSVQGSEIDIRAGVVVEDYGLQEFQEVIKIGE